MKSSMASVNEFVSQKTIAVVGVSRNDKKFGNAVYRELKKKGYKVYPVNSNAGEIEGEKFYNDLNSFPETPGGVVLSIKPDQTLGITREAVSAGIKNIWMQQGSESEQAIQFCAENGINVIHNQCILMFAGQVDSIHKFHRAIWKIFGKLPK